MPQAPYQDNPNEFTTPRSIKTLKRIQKLQDAPSLTNSLDFTEASDSTPKRQKKSKGRDFTPEIFEPEEDQKTSIGGLQSTFTALLNQSDNMKKSCFQLLNPASENSAQEAFCKLTMSSNIKTEEGSTQFPDFIKYKDDCYKIAVSIIRAYFFTFNQRSEVLAKLFIQDCPFEIIKENMHTFQETIQCLSQTIKSFELDESKLEFIYIDNKEPFIITGYGKAFTMNGSILNFTQSFKIGHKGFTLGVANISVIESIVESYAVMHTKLMLSP